jgi:hypothetical protein
MRVQLSGARILRWIVLSLGCSLGIGLLVSYAALSRFSHATQYCPLAHKLNPDMICHIKDQKGEEVLIEHHDADLAKVELSIYKHGQHSWLKYPECCNVSSELDSNSITFNPQRNDSLLVNGIPIELGSLR